MLRPVDRCQNQLVYKLPSYTHFLFIRSFLIHNFFRSRGSYHQCKGGLSTLLCQEMRKLMAGKVQGKAYLGSVNQKVAPCPSSESTPRVPPWASMIFLQITSPSPLDFSPPVGFELILE